MLVSMKDILQHAHKHNYAVMAVNSINMEMARAVISAAEEEHSPIIVQMGPGQIGKHAHLTEIVSLLKPAYAPRQSRKSSRPTPSFPESVLKAQASQEPTPSTTASPV